MSELRHVRDVLSEFLEDLSLEDWNTDYEEDSHDPPEGVRWLTPQECRERLEALRQHPEPEGLQGTVHRIMMHAYARGAER